MKQWQAVITDYINQHVDSDICMIKVFNPEKIDKLILPLVLKMREAGFQTMGSCMGDVGHGTGMSCFTIPYVQCLYLMLMKTHGKHYNVLTSFCWD